MLSYMVLATSQGTFPSSSHDRVSRHPMKGSISFGGACRQPRRPITDHHGPTTLSMSRQLAVCHPP